MQPIKRPLATSCQGLHPGLLSPEKISFCPIPRRAKKYLHKLGRSSDFPALLATFPSPILETVAFKMLKGFLLPVREKGEVTATGPCSIYTSFPIKPAPLQIYISSVGKISNGAATPNLEHIQLSILLYANYLFLSRKICIEPLPTQIFLDPELPDSLTGFGGEGSYIGFYTIKKKLGGTLLRTTPETVLQKLTGRSEFLGNLSNP